MHQTEHMTVRIACPDCRAQVRLLAGGFVEPHGSCGFERTAGSGREAERELRARRFEEPERPRRNGSISKGPSATASQIAHRSDDRRAANLRRAEKNDARIAAALSAAIDGPVSSHREAQQSIRSNALVKRVDRDWARYGFSDKERDLWVSFGVPADRAPIAFICNEVQGVPGFRLTPDRLAMKLPENGSILNALLMGTHAARLEDRISRALGREPEQSPTAWRRIIDRANIAPIYPSTQREELRNSIHTAAGVPALYDSLLSWADSRGPIFGQRFQLQYQAHKYLRGADEKPGKLLVSYARVLGVADGMPELKDVAMALRAPDDDARSYRIATIFAANATSRYLYYVGTDAHRQVEAVADGDKRTFQINADRLPSPTGFVLLAGDKVDDGLATSVLAWHVDAGTLHVTTATSRQLVKELLTSSVKSSPDRQVMSIHLQATETSVPVAGSGVLATLSAFLEVLTLDPMNETRHGDRVNGRNDHRPASVTFLHSREPALRPKTTPRVQERNFQWTVRGHWRNQWRPSTKDHTRLWIEEHRAGPEDAPLMNRDRVRMVRSVAATDESPDTQPTTSAPSST